MNILHAGLIAGTLSCGFALVARADYTCTPCNNGQQYCGDYNSASGQWSSGQWLSCNGPLPPPPPPAPPSCQNQPGHSDLAGKYQSGSYCRAVRPHSNECARLGTPTVLIGTYTCEYNNFDGCGNFIGTVSQACGETYLRCGC